MADSRTVPAAGDGCQQVSREEMMQRRLDEMRRERQAELRRISKTAAPAVHTGHRALNRLLQGDNNDSSQASSSSSSSAAAAASTSVPNQSSAEAAADSGREASDSERAILVEVRGLFEARPVSRILQSSSFRTELESLVRSSLAPRPAPAARQPPQQVPVQLGQSSAPPMASSGASASEAELAPPVALTEAELNRIRHDDFVQEISELLHTQLVTNTLSSGFRSRLERSVRLRAEGLQDGGRRAVETLSRLPPSNIVRNDFSHLGIVPADQQSLISTAASDQLLDDAVSVVSVAAAAAAVGAQPDPGVSKQLRQMQKEMHELRRMLQQLASGHLETQRMIRQEVGAALAGCQSPPASSSGFARPAAASGCCLICLRATADTVLYRCGHLCLCAACSGDLRDRSEQPKCPVCRAPVVDAMRVYAAAVTDAEH